MSTVQEITLDAFRALGAVDINDTGVSGSEMTAGIRVLNAMVTSWSALGLATLDKVLTGTVAASSAEITDLDTTDLAKGINVAGTGIPAGARIKSVDKVDATAGKITLTANATAGGSAVSLTFAAIPFEQKYEQGLIALLALRLAPLIGEDNIPAVVVEDARSGWIVLQAGFMTVPTAKLDELLLNTSSQRVEVPIE